MMTNDAKVKLMTDRLAEFIAYTAKKLPDDVIGKLRELQAQETDPLPKVIYETMFRNQELAVQWDRPSCQDTGALQF
jgi:L(+)-tartrate dehydratase alpha subunit